MKAADARKKKSREKRGEITTEIKQQFERYSDEELTRLLSNPDAQSRTAAAMQLGRRRCLAAIATLCEHLSKETALYTRIALSEALGAIGEPALADLSDLVGKVGRNQHQALPKGLFKKWNYPLPRDIVIRTIVNIGPAALPLLIEKLNEISEISVMAELIDAIGYISYYSRDWHAFEALKTISDKNLEQPVIIWKMIRAFQAFPQTECLEFLKETLLTYELPQHRWEAARSLGQIGSPEAEGCLISAVGEQHTLVLEMIQRSLQHIRKEKKPTR